MNLSILAFVAVLGAIRIAGHGYSIYLGLKKVKQCVRPK